jgi:predicted ArsR family transcriptional regulator
MDSDLPPPDARDDLDAIGALAEPTRRALYEYVTSRREWVSREQAADAVGIQRGIAAHHLDRLADDGLLETDYRRLNERRGPGAGRPAKVYRRTPAEIAVSLPPRQYELAGRVLADAADRSQRTGIPIGRAIDEAARHEAKVIAADPKHELGRRAGATARRARLFAELRARGFEPETLDDGVTVLHNCPFHHLAQQHTELICGMNLCLLDTLVDELEGTGLRAALEPEVGYCCVRFHPDAHAPGQSPPIAGVKRAR